MFWKKAASYVLAMALMAGCSSATPNKNPGNTSPEAPQLPVTVKTAYLPILSMGPLFVAEDMGFWSKRGIKNEFTSNANVYELLPVMSKGDLDVSIVGTGAAFFNALNSGLKLKAVSDRMRYSCASDNMLSVSQKAWDAGVRKVTDLKGKKVAILARGSATEYWLQVLLQQNGMTEKDLGGVVVLSYTDTYNAFKTGAVEAGFLAEPQGYQAISEGVAHRLIAVHEIVPNQQLGEIVMSDMFTAKESGKMATAWLAGWLEGVRYFQDPANKEKVISIVSKWTRVDEKYVRELYGTDQWPWADPNGDVDTAAIAAQDGKWLLEQKLITSMPDVAAYYNSKFVKAAQAELGVRPIDRQCGAIPKIGG